VVSRLRGNSPASPERDINRGRVPSFLLGAIMNHDKVKAIARNLKLLAISLEDAIKEDVEAYNTPSDAIKDTWFPKKQAERLGYRYSDDDDGYAD